MFYTCRSNIFTFTVCTCVHVFLDIYELLKDNLCQDDAVVGEAAGLAMGLVMIGTRSPNAIHDMIEVILIIAPLYSLHIYT